MQFSSLYFYALFNFEKKQNLTKVLNSRYKISIKKWQIPLDNWGTIEQIVGKSQKTKWSEKIADAHL